jgi:DNA-binding IclR family transcriptional regulator
VGKITRLTGFNQSTVSQFLVTLALRKCLEQTGPPGQYRLGVRSYQWSSLLRNKDALAELAWPLMERLRVNCGEQAALSALRDGNRICVEVVKSRYGLAQVTPVGKILPVHCTAGRCFWCTLRIGNARESYRGSPWASLHRPPSPTALPWKGASSETAFSVDEREEGRCSLVASSWSGRARVLPAFRSAGRFPAF